MTPRRRRWPAALAAAGTLLTCPAVPLGVQPGPPHTAFTIAHAVVAGAGSAEPSAPQPAPFAAANRTALPAGCRPPPADAVAATTDAARLLHLDAVHRLATGAGQTIAVVDTGVAPHPRLGTRLRGAGDLIATAQGRSDGRADCDGHGTAVAGLLAAAPGRADDLVGMAPGARLITIRQTGTGADGRPAGDVDSLARAVTLAVDAGATVVNLSEAACLTAERAERDGAHLRAALRAATRRDVVVVAAAGNLGVGGCTGGAPAGEIALPGWFAEDVLTVGASGPDGAPAAFTVPGPWVDVAAPGTGLRSLAAGGGLRGGLDGTSFATPWVAGLVALVRERFPELTAAEVVDRVLATARRPAGGRDPLVGHGVVDPLAALTAVPARLRPDAPAGPRSAVLAGTEPVGAPAEPDPPVELLAVAALAAAACSGVAALRRRPDRS
ncbi:type VII secretion-associated serine protease mycosin [Pseudonocardia sp.]|uniref:type VII secretion-associated serine protease mycosin n=1 Tax=Pseudonocardia sp. TaxID=60912 RepID=UPI003D125D24